MDFDNLEPTESKDYVIGADLSELSVDELTDLITLLKDEIGRLEKDIAKKQVQRSDADSAFKT